jgi:hypothetical protein
MPATVLITTTGPNVSCTAEVVATLAYRLVNYWLPLPFGAVADLRLRLRAVDRRPVTRGRPGRPRYQRPGRPMTATDDMPPQLPLVPGPAPVLTQFPRIQY